MIISAGSTPSSSLAGKFGINPQAKLMKTVFSLTCDDNLFISLFPVNTHNGDHSEEEHDHPHEDDPEEHPDGVRLVFVEQRQGDKRVDEAASDPDSRERGRVEVVNARKCFDSINGT